MLEAIRNYGYKLLLGRTAGNLGHGWNILVEFIKVVPATTRRYISEENLKQVVNLYLNKVFKLYASSKNVVYDNVSKVKLQYDKECNPQLRVGIKDVDCLFNVYPKEWMINEITQDGLLKYDFEKLRSVEPFWKLIVANKALLPLLWSMYPNHPNLLPAYYDDPKSELGAVPVNTKWVSKPLFGREGLGVFLSNNFTSYDAFV